MKNLTQLEKGQNATINKVNCKGELKKRLTEMGVTKGTQIQVLKVAPLGDPIEISLKGYNLSVRKSEAKEIFID